MNILGVGPAEVFVIVLLMLIVAGPKRMIAWAYQAGRYTAMMRRMFQETMDQLTREFEESGLDVSKDLPNLKANFDIIGEASRVINADLKGETPDAKASTAPAPSAASASSTTSTDTASTANSSTPTPTPNKPAGAKDDEETPRYDAWTPN